MTRTFHEVEVNGHIYHIADHKLIRLYQGGYGKQCSKCGIIKELTEYSPNGKDATNRLRCACKECERERSKKYMKDNPDKVKRNIAKRQHRLTKLPNTFTLKNYREMLNAFDYKCALTGDASDIVIDHFIPISIGHGGNTIGNNIPLSRSINASKSNRNPFEWIKERPDLDYERFHQIVSYLAITNGMSVSAYIEYVEWCFKHPRIL
jgi:HNH endonuclease